MGRSQKFRRVVTLPALSALHAFVTIVALVFTVNAEAQMIEVKLPSAAPKSANAQIKKLKTHALKSEWALCAKTGPGAFAVAGPIRGWVLLNWMKCASKSDQRDKKLTQLPTVLKQYLAQTNLREGPWAEELKKEAITARLWLLDSFLKTQPALANQYLESLFVEISPRQTGDLAKAWSLLGDAAQAKHDLAGAESAYQQSLRLTDTSSVQEKLKSMRLSLNRTETAKLAQTRTENVFSEAETNFQKRFQASKEKNDPILQLEDALAYLRELPNGTMANRAVDQILEIHSDLLGRMYSGSSADRWRLVEERAIATLLSAEPDRLRIWLPVLYRRGDYAGALRVGEKIVSKYDGGVFGDEVLWYTARAAQITGELKKADKYFAALLEKHGGSSLAREAELQWALVHMRNKNYASAVASLEKLLRSPGGDKFELQARYWMVRAFEAQDNPRAKEEARLIIDKYPASYYGIRLSAEVSGGEFEWPFPSDTTLKGLKGSLRLNVAQKAAWDRMQLLRANGYQQEALQETDLLPLPEDPTLKVLWAQELTRAEAFPKAIRLLNEVGDLTPELRSLDVLRLGLPQSFDAAVNLEAKKQRLNPILVRSLIRQESAFNPWAVSRSNALGLMQLIPPTAKEVAQELKMGALDVPDDVFRTDTNIQMGSSYLAKMLRNFSGSVPFALAAYNAGPRRIEMFLSANSELKEISKTPSSAPLDEVWIDELPWSETSFYVKAILRNSFLYKAAASKRVKLSGVLWEDLVVRPGSPDVSPSVSPGSGD